MTEDSFFEFYRVFSHGERDPTTDSAHLVAFAQLAQQNREAAPETWEHAVDDAMYAIAQSPALLAPAVCAWLTCDELVPLARIALRHAGTKEAQAVLPVAFNLSSEDPEAAALAGRRLCSVGAAVPLCVGWALSLARDHGTHPAVVRSVRAMLMYLSNELPGTTERVLAAEGSPFASDVVAIEALAALREHEAALASIPDLRELRPTREMRWILSRLRRDEQRAIHREAEKRSVLSALFATRRHVKYARRVVIDIVTPEGPRSSTLTMGEMSLSIEVPLSDTTDPIFGRLRRTRLWRDER